MTRIVNAGMLESIVDRINALGAKVTALGKAIPGVGWAAELGEISLSNNKYVRAAQILATIVTLPIGGVGGGVIGIFVLIKKALSGDDDALRMLDTHADTMQAQVESALSKQQAQPVSASVKNPILRARLIMVSQSIRLLDEAKKVAKGNGKLTSQLAKGDVIEWKGAPMEILKAFEGDLLVKYKGRSLNLTLPHQFVPVLKSAPSKKNWFSRAADTEALTIMSGNILTDIGNSVAPRTTKNVTDMTASDEDEDEEACGGPDMDACGMDDGSYPAGPRNDANKSRYHVQPSHGQSTVDLLRFTASLDSMVSRLSLVANG